MTIDTCAVRTTRPSGKGSERTTATDQTLIEMIAKGDQGALRALFTRHYSRIHRFALRFVKNQDDAETVVNDTFLIAWQQAHQFEGRSQVATWLLGIARFRALGTLKPQRPRFEDVENYSESLVDPEERVDERMRREDSNRYLRQCLSSLPREQAQLIELHYFGGVSLKDAVAVTGVPINTIKTRMFLARRKLARLMSEEEDQIAPALQSLALSPSLAMAT
jgi:RNA polymerase sigma-70 factor (ECF subfamily)